MAKFYGEIGYSETVETSRGVWEEVITERKAFGELLRVSRRLESGEKINSDISVGNSISIIADAYANEHFFAMQYVIWAGARWIVSNVDVERPRLILTLGGVYNGPTAGPSDQA